MRLLFPVAMAIAVTAQAQGTPLQQASPLKANDCPRASNHFAGNPGSWRGAPVKPKKLSELPPADTYAAMLRTDSRGCMVAVKYRDVRR